MSGIATPPKILGHRVGLRRVLRHTDFNIEPGF
jgi:hypothetical protein